MKAKPALRNLYAADLVAAAVSICAAAAWPFVTYYRVAAQHISPAAADVSAESPAVPGR